MTIEEFNNYKEYLLACYNKEVKELKKHLNSVFNSSLLLLLFIVADIVGIVFTTKNGDYWISIICSIILLILSVIIIILVYVEIKNYNSKLKVIKENYKANLLNAKSKIKEN